MFSNIGHKIQVLAKVICWIGIALSIILGVLITASSLIDHMFYGLFFYNIGAKIAAGVGFALLGSLFSWIGSFFIYGFGDLIQSNRDMRDVLCSAYANRIKKNREA